MSDEDKNVKIAKFHPSKSGNGGVFSGVGDRDVESHITTDKEGKAHVSTYVNLGQVADDMPPNEKIKVDQYDVTSDETEQGE